MFSTETEHAAGHGGVLGERDTHSYQYQQGTAACREPTPHRQHHGTVNNFTLFCRYKPEKVTRVCIWKDNLLYMLVIVW